jgi:ribosomal-protein-alanine N-acetyltransferase
MPDFCIRRMKIPDIVPVQAIEQATFAIPWSLNAFHQELELNPCARYLVAERAGVILGYAGAWMVLDEGHVTNIAVEKSARGQGIGRMLTAGLLQYAANLGVSYMTLEVRAGNQTAQNLYRSLGFVKVGVRKKYYEDNGEDGFIMVCDHLPPAQDDFTEDETMTE